MPSARRSATSTGGVVIEALGFAGGPLSQAGRDWLVGLGPASEGAHTDRETVDIPSIWRQAKRAAILMSRLSAEKR